MSLSSRALKLGATAATVLGLAGGTVYVVTHVRNPAAPLKPPVIVRVADEQAAAPGVGRFRPSVRVADLPALTFTYVS